MKDKQQLYKQWLAHRRQISVPDTFSKNVMEAIDQDSNRKRENNNVAYLSERLQRPFYHQRPFYQWITASGLVLLGLFRIMYITGTLLRTNLIMP